MRKTVRWAIAFGILVTVAIGAWGILQNETSGPEPIKHKTESTEITTGYYLMENDGYVIVYMADRKTVFEYTSIPVNELDDTLQREIRFGKYLDTIGQVYGFLENYSS